MLKKIVKKIKDYKTIVIVRHVGPDPDAIASQMALRESIKLTYPSKKVYAIGCGVSRFKCYGLLDKVNLEEMTDSLLIALDVPNMGRIDGIDGLNYKEILRIDHHPDEDIIATINWGDVTYSSTCQMIAELILHTNLRLNESIASNLFLGIMSDSDRFLLSNTTTKTMETTVELLKKSKLDFTKYYGLLYIRPMNEIKFQAYITNNLTITENGLGHILITNDIIKEYGVDTATASNIINNFNFIKELYAWVFITYDEKNELYKINIRSRGPVINDIASKYHGGGHKYASGSRIIKKSEVDELINDLDNACKNYIDSI